MQSKNNFLVAITGGIGSGKSTALNLLKDMGYFVVSCDEITKKLYKTRQVKLKIKEIFPLAVSGTKRLRVNKKEIARQVFTDKKLNEKLTQFLTPLIFNQSIKTANRKKGIIFIEVPLLFEMGYQDKFDKVIVVLREKENRILSVINRSNLTKSQVLDRINAQVDYNELDLSYYIKIKNNGDINDLKKHLSFALKQIK